MALDVHRGSRVTVVTPDATDVVGAVNQNEVVEAGLLQSYRGGDRTETGADDRDVMVRDGVGHHDRASAPDREQQSRE